MKNNRISIIFHTLLISSDILMPEKPRTEPVQFCDKHNFVTPAAQNVMRKSLIYGFSHFSPFSPDFLYHYIICFFSTPQSLSALGGAWLLMCHFYMKILSRKKDCFKDIVSFILKTVFSFIFYTFTFPYQKAPPAPPRFLLSAHGTVNS